MVRQISALFGPRIDSMGKEGFTEAECGLDLKESDLKDKKLVLIRCPLDVNIDHWMQRCDGNCIFRRLIFRNCTPRKLQFLLRVH